MSMNAGALKRLDDLELHVIAEIKAIRAMLEVTSEPAPIAPTPPPATSHDARFAFGDGTEEAYGRFYDFLRGNKMLGPKISPSEFEGCDAIIKACTQLNFSVSFTAYCLATAYLETAHTMQPVHERGGKAYLHRMYDIQGARPAKARELGNLSPGDGVKYAGRGYPQMTGKRNYELATKKLRALGFDVDLVANPDLAMRPDIAAAIMTLGMRDGWFTGRKLSDDLPLKGPASRSQFVASRDIVNGRDKDDEIAAFAIDFQTGLLAGGYRIGV